MTHDATPLTPTDDVPVRTAGILDRLAELRRADAPTHGGRVLSYVYDPGLAELDELAAAAIRAVQPLNGLDPTTFTSIAVMERELLAFARTVLHGDDDVVGSVTAGGTESCMLAVKTARDALRTRHRRAGTTPPRPRIVLPTTAHAAFRKAAAFCDMDLDLVPVDPATGVPSAADMIARIGDDVALVVVSAPAYPHGAIDPVVEVAAAGAAAGVPVHVDACVGGWVLPFWDAAGGGEVPPFDFRVPGVTSISADVHKYGYVPKGTSVLLVRGRDLHRHQFFAVTDWPGYPVVNATLAGSRSAGPLAAAWAVTQALGVDGYTALTRRCVEATARLREVVDQIDGLRVVGSPTGPLICVAADESVSAERQVDPHVWADETKALGWIIQAQPGLAQSDGTHLPHTTHLTVTPVTASVVDDLGAVLATAADRARGVARPAPHDVLAQLLASLAPGATPEQALALFEQAGSDDAWAIVQGVLGAAGTQPAGTLPARMAPVLSLVEALPPHVSGRLLVEIIARLTEPS
ncbi:glutamate/tyrosine decarboxylase-like PLP-dependent enzyme [Sediminihabitans luteus]|uniref:Glutamate/tyrosine decarboxylase-like PLP-dependent enzyme n=1 Tax=Sediminihabitans luteus TaxID=1138585 RepID=A0A2M9CYH1_9CELL|nr:pyridoxal-dependent decarboxylase [Sediminihabitans luteus]PJJ76893.1 glutamate/tyrosine decarboxylase-like PLP-dependent enzyme [Sediminihabitans luteus]GII99534.1 aspartate aminotransferase family protein [Sediminihabitans luteus]